MGKTKMRARGARRCLAMLKIDKKDDGRCVILMLDGELSYDTADRLKSKVDESRPHDGRHVVLDMGALDFMDSSGASCLLRIRNGGGAKGVGETVLASVPPGIYTTLMRLGLVNNYRIFSSTADAVDKLR